jgi:DNA mismatch endonuclease (patch repair protein)
MVDIVPPETRSRMMAANRRRDTKPEMIVRRHLHAQGFRYRLDVGRLAGRPDIVLARHRVTIFVHGCFWHRHDGCRNATMPKSNVGFWRAKFERNVERDRTALGELLAGGWRVAVVWECALRRDEANVNLAKLDRWIGGCETRLDLPTVSTA